VDNFFTVIIILGALLLVASLKTTVKVCKKTSQRAWSVLLCAIIFFIIGYWWILYYFSNHDIAPVVMNMVAMLLLGGGGFVFLVIKLSLKSILKIEQATQYQKYQTEHDNLTTLPNRDKFFKSLSKQVEYPSPFSLFYIDLNNFKQINDAFGHQCGDQLLAAFANKLNKELCGIAKLYRIGGDEFAFLLHTDTDESMNYCVNIINSAVKSPFCTNEQMVKIQLSIGVSRFPDDSRLPDQLLKKADLALHEAKKTFQPLVNYSSAIGKRAEDFFDLSAKIKVALHKDEFELYLQPIMDSKDLQLHGLEALIRWPQDDGSFISPEKFITVAERTGLIFPLSKWVVQEAVNHIRKLKLFGFTGTIHVNLSTKDIESSEFYDFIISLLATDPTLSDSLIFEITEGAMMTNIPAARKMMQQLSMRGFKFSVDDFGTGFSSLSLLRELPINQIKIDQSFIKDMLINPPDYAIVESTLFLASRLNCDVVAEGIETKEVEQALLSLNCDYLQGYLYSKPINIDEFINVYLSTEKVS